jgi:1-acyl-sn-glycerol-3-phosphate acyltransferase
MQKVNEIPFGEKTEIFVTGHSLPILPATKPTESRPVKKLSLNREVELIEFILKNVEKYVIPYHKASVNGLEKIPENPVLFVGNHNGAMVSIDSFIFLSMLYKKFGISRFPYYLIHEKLLEIPVLKSLLKKVGAVLSNHENAHEVLSAGNNAMVYPGGDYESMRPFRDRNKIIFAGRTGYIRLALRENIPVVPVVTAGAHSVYYIIDDLKWLAKLINSRTFFRTNAWPLTISIPWGLTLGPVFFFPYPAKIIIEVLDPVIFSRSGEEASQDEKYVSECSLKVEYLMQKALTRLTS